ncbi:MAG: hypothetical protein WCO79_00885 [bacterium]
MNPLFSFLQAAAGAASASGAEVPRLPSLSFEDIFIWIINFFFDIAGADYQQTVETLVFAARFFSIFLSLLFIVGTIYAKMQAKQIEIRRHHRAAPKKKHAKAAEGGAPHASGAHGGPANLPTGIPAGLPVFDESAEVAKKARNNERWAAVLENVGSASDSDWRLAILEADIILDDMLKGMGTFGDTVAERLKSVNEHTIPSVQKAWEAHLVRNRIAHDGANFALSQHEARRIIGLFETVLKEGRFL